MNILFIGPSGCVRKVSISGNKNNRKIDTQFSNKEIKEGETTVDHSGYFIGLKDLLSSVV